jgi:voltage-gated potassium channel
MTRNPLIWIGLAGVAPDDNPRALAWQRKLHPFMVAIALLSVPAYFFDTALQHPDWHRVATVLDALILTAFLAELAWMLWVTSFPAEYLAENWLNLVIVVGAGAAVLGAATEWVAVVRVMRVAISGLVMIRALSGFHALFTHRGAPALVGIAIVTMLGAGGVFYWLDPGVNTYWDGLWLAFTTGTTVGYGDVVPGTGASRAFAAFMVLVGVSLMTLFTANVVTFFIGREETELRSDLHHDVVKLRGELARLIGAEELRIHRDLHHEVRMLRDEIQALREALDRPPASDERGKPG